jgi:2-oxoglutarate ferredoxin oxidoreductase subunit delta
MSSDLNHKGYHFARLIADSCTGCVNCALVCPDAVITVYRQSRASSTPQSAVAATMT